MLISVERCHGRDDCRPDAEIDDFFRGKYLVVIHNQRKFDHDNFEEESIITESILTWISISSQVRMMTPYLITRSEAYL